MNTTQNDFVNNFKAIYPNVPKSWIEEAYNEVKHLKDNLEKTELYKKVYQLTHIDYPKELGSLLRSIVL